ncbi:MAG: polysaccharide deacetylase family protein [Polyangiaceae bacterium]
MIRRAAVAVYVSIHDVSPAWTDEVKDALDMCARVNIRPGLLVVPDYHHRAALQESPAFCQGLRDLQAQGHDILLHGLFHEGQSVYEGSSVRGRVGWLLAQRWMTAGEAELHGLGVEEGRRRIAEGERVLREVGLTVSGYVAPGWSMPGWLVPLLAARGYRYCEDHLRIYDPARRRSRPSVVLNWATRSPGRVLSTIAWCRVARHARSLVPTRIAIHPADLRVLAVRREVARLLDWAQGHCVEHASALLD